MDTVWESLMGKQIVIDSDAHYIYIGELASFDSCSVTLTNVDVHDYSQSSLSSENYVHDVRKNGVQPNRKSVVLFQHRMVSVTLLTDVIDF